MRLRLRRRHGDKLDKRLAEARLRAQDATAELELSRERARHKRETVVMPLRRRGEENQFAEMLRASLQIGYGNGDSR